MARKTERRLVLMVTGKFGYSSSGTQRCLYIRSADDDSISLGEKLYSYGSVTGVTDTRDATNLHQLSIAQGMDLYFNIKNNLAPNERVELMSVEINIDLTPSEFDPEMLQEYLRGRAISKLTRDEIEALGVGNLAIYNKLKYHNVVDENDEDAIQP